ATRASRAQPRLVTPVQRPPGADLTIYLMTMGVGTEIWEMFGHNALWIHDARAGTDRTYNWGGFEFNAPDFLPHFLKGLNIYRVDTASVPLIIQEYRYLNRTVVAQELDLSPADRDSVRAFADWNMLPEHQNYR